MKNTAFKTIAWVAGTIATAAIALHGASARSGSGHGGNNSSAAQNSKISRDASSGQATGKRHHAPVRAVTPSANTATKKQLPGTTIPAKIVLKRGKNAN
jgi:hypothetical protein